jgi:hypothetical protein
MIAKVVMDSRMLVMFVVMFRVREGGQNVRGRDLMPGV